MRFSGIQSGDLTQSRTHREGFLREVALRLREVKKSTQGHTAGKGKSWVFDPECLTPLPMFYSLNNTALYLFHLTLPWLLFVRGEQSYLTLNALMQCFS